MFSIKSFLWMSDDPRHVWVRDRLLETVSKNGGKSVADQCC
jgi:hypothetical protein